jgi:hypothetical protein
LERQLNFSFNTTPGVGHTDAEAVERTWAEMNSIRKFTREMGPGSRSDYIDDFSGNRNWKRTIHFGRCLNKTLNSTLVLNMHNSKQSSLQDEGRYTRVPQACRRP